MHVNFVVSSKIKNVINDTNNYKKTVRQKCFECIETCNELYCTEKTWTGIHGNMHKKITTSCESEIE